MVLGNQRVAGTDVVWNAFPDWPSEAAFAADFARFYSIIMAKEVPWWKELGFRYSNKAKTHTP